LAKNKNSIWEKAPRQEDFANAENYLSLVYEYRDANRLVQKLRHSKPVKREAKDVLRASDLPLLDKDDAHVASDLKRIGKKKKLSPVLLIRGDARKGAPMVVADGYHRICASNFWDENDLIACCIVWKD
jgi:phosphatidylserine/phosphatidylglycerophosphate/cardiolipin synthase-like enzyme